MHPQLQLVADEDRSAQARLHDLVRAVPDEQWSKRSDRARWSVAECVAHLNITSLAYVPLLQHAVSRARMLERRSPSRYRREIGRASCRERVDTLEVAGSVKKKDKMQQRRQEDCRN